MAGTEPYAARARELRGCSLARVTSVLTALLGVLLLVELLAGTAVEPYDVTLVGTVVVGALATSVRMWRRTSFETRVAAVLLAAMVLVGQLLVSTVGVPGRPPSQWSWTGIAVAVLALTIPALVTADARQTWPVERAEHPYAL